MDLINVYLPQHGDETGDHQGAVLSPGNWNKLVSWRLQTSTESRSVTFDPYLLTKVGEADETTLEREFHYNDEWTPADYNYTRVSECRLEVTANSS